MIGEIEDQLIQRVKGHFNRHLRSVESLPSDFDAKEFDRILRSAPGVFAVFAGAQASDPGSYAQGRGQWSLVVVTDHASGELARRRGNTLQIGAYEIIERLVALLHDFSMPGVGTLQFRSIDNLYSGVLENKGISMYAVVFSLPMSFDINIDDLQSLDNFERFDADIDLAPADAAPESHDTVLLDQ